MARRNALRGGGGVTVHDVARHAGVSAMTVSRVVNGEKNVREETRAKVREAIESLNYSPNLAARRLASDDTVRVGLLYANPSVGYLSELLVGVLEACSQGGCQLMIENCAGTEDAVAAIQKLLRAGADGVLLPPPLSESDDAITALIEAGSPAVAIASGQDCNLLGSVRIDDFEAARAMTARLIEQGHRKIGFIIGDPQQSASALRLKGYRAALAAAGAETSEAWIAQGYFTYRSGLEAAAAILQSPNRPTAIFASNDDMAAAAVAAAHRFGLDVPTNLTVVGFDDTPLASAVWPELTTVRQPIFEMGKQAVQLVVEQIRAKRTGEPYSRVVRSLDHALIERASSAPLK